MVFDIAGKASKSADACSTVNAHFGVTLASVAIDADADRMRQLLASTFKAFQQRALLAARKKHEERTAKITAQQFQLPASPGERRALLDAVIAQHQQAGRMLIAQHREFTELTDEDVESWLQQFGALGLLQGKPGSEK